MDDNEWKVSLRRFYLAAGAAKMVLKRGDRIRVKKCPGGKRTITFECWKDDYIVSKSGIGGYIAGEIDRVNGSPISFVL